MYYLSGIKVLHCLNVQCLKNNLLLLLLSLLLNTCSLFGIQTLSKHDVLGSLYSHHHHHHHHHSHHPCCTFPYSALCPGGRPLRTASKERACPPAPCLELATGGTSKELEEEKKKKTGFIYSPGFLTTRLQCISCTHLPNFIVPSCTAFPHALVSASPVPLLFKATTGTLQAPEPFVIPQ